jgi:hypothetical protein
MRGSRQKEKDEEGIMKMKVALYMTNVLIIPDAVIFSALHGDIRQ